MFLTNQMPNPNYGKPKVFLLSSIKTTQCSVNLQVPEDRLAVVKMFLLWLGEPRMDAQF